MAGESPAAVLHDSTGQERGHEPQNPVFVQDASEASAFEWERQTVIEADQPAVVESGNSEPYNIGGTTLTIAINGTSDPQAFPTRAATAGIFVSGQYPSLNGGTEKIKISIDGGVEEEIKIGKNLTSYTAIASAIQTQIQAIVPNGTGVTCQWNTAAYPQRFLITSATTGATSAVTARKGGDDCALFLKLDPTVGGFAVNGLAANNYYASEVPGLVDIAGADVFVVDDTDLRIETVEFGATKSIQVTAGGANAAFGFPTAITYGQTSAGATNMNVDGSTTPKRFELRAGAKTFVADKMIIFVRDDNAAVLKNFGGLAQLTNGVLVEVRSQDGDLHEFFTAQTNSDLIAWCDDGQAIDDAYDAGGKDLVVATFYLKPRLTLRGGSNDAIRFTIQDNLTGLNEMKAYLFGRVYEVT